MAAIAISSTSNDPQQAPTWWETIATVRAAIQSLSATIGPLPSLPSLLDSATPAHSLLHSPDVAASISAHLSAPTSGSAADPLCRWLYDAFQSAHSDLHLVVLRYVPLLAALYLARLVAPHRPSDPPAGFEAVILALYSSQVKARGGRPLVVNIPDLGQPSLYHAPRHPAAEAPLVGQLAAPLEPHVAIKSTKRATIVGVVLELFHRHIAAMPAAAKIEFCEFVQGWAGQNCSCASHFIPKIQSISPEIQSISPKIQSLSPQIQSTSPKIQSLNPQIQSISPEIQSLSPQIQSLSPEIQSVSHETQSVSPEIQSVSHEIQSISPCESSRSLVDGVEEMGIEPNGSADNKAGGSSSFSDSVCGEFGSKGTRIPLPWELLQPILGILGHCLFGPLNPPEVVDAASVATRVLFARVSHELVPEAILATRSLMRLDMAARVSNESARSAVNGGVDSGTPTRAKKPEVLLVSK